MAYVHILTLRADRFYVVAVPNRYVGQFRTLGVQWTGRGYVYTGHPAHILDLPGAFIDTSYAYAC